MRVVAFVRTRALLVPVIALAFTSLIFSLGIYPTSIDFRRSQATPTRTCTTLKDSLDGRWTPRVPPYESLDDFTLGDERGRVEAQECISPTGADLERTLAVANWVWTPNHCAMRPWDAEAFVVECLKMPNGIFLVGDSISGLQLKAMGSTIGQGKDSLLLRQQPRQHRVAWKKEPGGESKFVNPTHPFYTKLLESGRFSASRLERPIVTRLASYHLISNELLVDFFNAAGGNSTTGRNTTRYDWGNDHDFVLSVEAAMASYDVVADEDGVARGTDEASVPTVVIINSGAHWTTAKIEGSEDPAVILRAFEQMVQQITKRLQDLPQSRQRLRLIARTNPPPPDRCDDTAGPLEPPHQVPIGTQFNYPSFPMMDDFWRADPRIEVLDLRPLVGTRPDGRRKPSSDCLHVCIPVARSWNEVLWNVM
ncbi:hypothetical protein RQP46_010167 [Phenoliferia psychrophenolica]